MNSQTVQEAFENELWKIAADLTSVQRADIPKKNFALTSKQSTTGKPAYPIHDLPHARLALAFVKMHGTDQQKGEVYKDVARKYPELAQRSSVPGLQEQAKSAMPSASVLLGHAPLPFPPKIPQLTHTALAEGLGTFTRHQPLAATTSSMAANTVRPGLKMAGLANSIGQAIGHESTIGRHLLNHHNAYDLGGLGILAAPQIDSLQHELRQPEVNKRKVVHSGLELGGLAALAAPVAMGALKGRT